MSAIDPLLEPFLRVADPEAEHVLAELLTEHAEPVVRRVVESQLGGTGFDQADREDVVAAVLARLTARLRRLRRGESDPERTIERFVHYAAVAGFNGCHELMRERAPRRARLAAQLRYLARRRVALAIEPGAGGEPWCHARPAPMDLRGSTARLVGAIHECFGGAARAPFSRLVDAVADRLGEVDRPGLEVDARMVEPTPSPEQISADRDLLRRLWPEILELPRPQRVALLLNLRDAAGREMSSLFVVAGIAGWDDLADALEIPREAAARLFPTLPRDDAWIAELLAVTPRQVINLRKAARARLARRMARWT